MLARVLVLLFGRFVGLSLLGLVRGIVRFASQHTGVPAVVVAALLVVVGWRLLKKSLRFVLEVALVTAALFAATQLGWIRW